MGILRRRDNDERITLCGHDVFGRSSACRHQYAHPHVSSEHARISWREDRWLLRDLGSRNGTFVGEHRLEPGEDRELELGDAIGLGADALRLLVTDLSPPVALAQDLDSDEVTPARDGVLLLRAEGAPFLAVFLDRRGRWILERAGQPAEVHDLETVRAADRRWVLHLPESTAGTLRDTSPRPTLSDVALRFAVSRDEEHVEVTVALPTGDQLLASRAHHYTWLTLARQRETGDGWVHAEDLARMLATDDNRINVDIYRIRREVGALGIDGAAGIIERRRSTRELRLVTDDIQVRLA